MPAVVIDKSDISNLPPVPVTWRLVVLVIFCSVGGFLFGYDIGVISGCLIMPDFIDRFGSGNHELNAHEQSLITSLLSAGTFFGALLQSPISDWIGRTKSLTIWSTIFCAGTAIQVSSEYSIGQISAGRLVAGLGVGAASGLVPLYLSEVVPKRVRGTLISIYQIEIIAGIVISYGIDWGTHTIPGSASWRIPVGLQFLWGVILITGSLMLPESPRWLIGRGRDDKARSDMARLRGVEGHHAAVEQEMNEIEQGIALENEGGGASYLELFSTSHAMWKRTLNGVMLQTLQQLCGQNFYYYYGDTFFQDAEVPLSPYAVQFILGMVSFVGTLPALWAIDGIGRRKGLMIGATGQFVCAMIVGLVGHFALVPAAAGSSQKKTSGEAFIAFAVIHIFFYSLFWGPIPWVTISESFPLRLRAKAISVAAASNWLWNFLLSYFSPKVAADHGPLIMCFFAIPLFFAICYSYIFIPEVRGLSLEEVDELYTSGVKPWKSSKWQPSVKNIDLEEARAHARTGLGPAAMVTPAAGRQAPREGGADEDVASVHSVHEDPTYEKDGQEASASKQP